MIIYDIQKFIDRIGDMDYHEILSTTQHEVYQAERGTSGVKGAVKKRESGALEYAADLKGLIFFLSTGTRSFGVSKQTFYSFKSIVQNLVDKKQFKTEALEVFK